MSNSKVKSPSMIFTDCLQCEDYQGEWTGELKIWIPHIDCKSRMKPALNCLDRRLECVRFKLKETNKK